MFPYTIDKYVAIIFLVQVRLHHFVQHEYALKRCCIV